MAPKTCDVLVIGGGVAGYPAAIRASQLGLRVVLVEKGNLGGVCLNVGCIPSKALITAAKHVKKLNHSLPEMGITTGAVHVDMKKMQEWKRGVVAKLTGGVGTLLKANKVDVMQGTARFIGPHAAEVTANDGAKTTVEAKHVILATGSRPAEIPGFKFDGKTVVSSTEVLDLDHVPKEVVVVGGGIIGSECGMMLANLGTKVTIVEFLPTILAGNDPEVVRVVERSMKKAGIDVHVNARAKSFDGTKITWEEGGKDHTASCDFVLLSVGRQPVSGDLGLDKAGVRVNEKGFVVVDRKQRTNVPHIYAIGDLAPGPGLAHKGTHEGLVAAEVIAGKAAESDFASIPNVIFTDPEVATAGLTEEEAKKNGHDVQVGKFPFAAIGRALTTMETDGFVKVVADRKTKVVLGVHIVGPNAADLISEASLALEMGATLDDLALTIHPHPTLPEAIMEAAEAAMGHAIHIVNAKR